MYLIVEVIDLPVDSPIQKCTAIFCDMVKLLMES